MSILNDVKTLMETNSVPCYTRGYDPMILYYPQRANYVLSFRQYADDDYVSVYAEGGDYQCDCYSADEVYNLIAEKHFKAKKSKDFVAEEIGRLQAFDKGCHTLSSYARNLNLMALEGKIFRAYGREQETEQILRIMLRKTKANALLVGSAGCGKTAIVENLAYYITDSRLAYLRGMADIEKAKRLGEEYDEVATPLFNDTIVYDLDLTSLVAGTKYRGEFEEKVRNIIKETEQNPNIVLFIDEIHQLNGLGTAEGSSGMGQLLKPALARGTLHCIGATTDEEVKLINNDKALSRRFNKVSVLPLGGEKAITACAKILADYSKIHNIEVEGVEPKDLFDIAQSQLKATSFPDNFINLVDETMAGAKFNRATKVTRTDFEATVLRLLGADVVSVKLGFQF